MTFWPEKLSSMIPSTRPKMACWRRKYRCDERTTTTTSTSETGTVRKVRPASVTETETIMTATPMICVTEVMSCVTLWLSDCPRVSTSLVTRLITSPTEFVSK